MLTTIQIVGLFFGMWFTSVNAVKFIREQPISWQNFAIQSAGWTAFIAVTWLVYP